MEEFTSISKSQYMTHQNHTALFLKASTALSKSHQHVNKLKCKHYNRTLYLGLFQTGPVVGYQYSQQN